MRSCERRKICQLWRMLSGLVFFGGEFYWRIILRGDCHAPKVLLGCQNARPWSPVPGPYHSAVFAAHNLKECGKVPLGGFPGDSVVKNLPAMQETWVQSLSWEDSLEKETPTCFSILAERLQRVWHNLATKEQQQYNYFRSKRGLACCLVQIGTNLNSAAKRILDCSVSFLWTWRTSESYAKMLTFKLFSVLQVVIIRW